ncbi:hypothetical protein BT69DRAFT_1077658, partial [Atractiella rhizophila]
EEPEEDEESFGSPISAPISDPPVGNKEKEEKKKRKSAKSAPGGIPNSILGESRHPSSSAPGSRAGSRYGYVPPPNPAMAPYPYPYRPSMPKAKNRAFLPFTHHPSSQPDLRAVALAQQRRMAQSVRSSATMRTRGSAGFGETVVVGKVEFDIDRRSGRARWYDEWLRQAEGVPGAEDLLRSSTGASSNASSGRERRGRDLMLPTLVNVQVRTPTPTSAQPPSRALKEHDTPRQVSQPTVFSIPFAATRQQSPPLSLSSASTHSPSSRRAALPPPEETDTPSARGMAPLVTAQHQHETQEVDFLDAPLPTPFSLASSHSQSSRGHPFGDEDVLREMEMYERQEEGMQRELELKEPQREVHERQTTGDDEGLQERGMRSNPPPTSSSVPSEDEHHVQRHSRTSSVSMTAAQSGMVESEGGYAPLLEQEDGSEYGAEAEISSLVQEDDGERMSFRDSQSSFKSHSRRSSVGSLPDGAKILSSGTDPLADIFPSDGTTWMEMKSETGVAPEREQELINEALAGRLPVDAYTKGLGIVGTTGEGIVMPPSVTDDDEDILKEDGVNEVVRLLVEKRKEEERSVLQGLESPIQLAPAVFKKEESPETHGRELEESMPLTPLTDQSRQQTPPSFIPPIVEPAPENVADATPTLAPDTSLSKPSSPSKWASALAFPFGALRRRAGSEASQTSASVPSAPPSPQPAAPQTLADNPDNLSPEKAQMVGSRQSSLDMMDNLDDLERALQELSPKALRPFPSSPQPGVSSRI